MDTLCQFKVTCIGKNISGGGPPPMMSPSEEEVLIPIKENPQMVGMIVGVDTSAPLASFLCFIAFL